MKFSKWHIAPAEEADIRRLGEAGYPQLVSQVLAARGISTAEEAAAFLEREPGSDLLPLPDEGHGPGGGAHPAGHRGTARRMAVFGDYDVDGITATVLLVDYLQRRGAECLRYIPRRMEDGYGLSLDAIRRLQEQGATLLITVDCGITGVEEVDYARVPGHGRGRHGPPRVQGDPADGPWRWWTPTGRTAPTPSSIWRAWAWR